MWGLRPQPLTAREGQAQTFEDLLETLPSPRKDCPTKLERPPLPDVTLQSAIDQPLSPVQKEVFDQIDHLDGHEDSGKPAPIPKTQGEASKYIAERNQAHQRFHEAQELGGQFTIFKDKSGEYRWRLEDAQGENVASSGEGFGSLAEAQREVTRVRKLSNSAKVTQDGGS